MSVAVVSETHFLGSNNAVSARVWNYAKALRLAGKDVYLLSYQDFVLNDALEEVSEGIFAYQSGSHKRPGIGTFLRELTRLVNDRAISGILFYPTPNPIFELRFLRWKKRQRFANVVCEVNEVRRFEQTYLKTFSLPKRIAYKWITAHSEKLTRCYKGIVCISDNIREYFSKYNNNAIVVPILSDIPKSIPKRNEQSGSQLRFVFTGTVAIEKENLIELLRGFYLFNKQYTDWELLFWGKVPSENKSRLENILGILGLTDKVYLMGEVEHQLVAGILSSADCLILPRKNTEQNYYGFSTKLSEYAVSGSPIILTDTGVVSNYFEDGRDCCKVQGYEAEGFCEQLKRFVSLSHDQKEEIAHKAYLTAKNHFDWRLYSDTLIKLLN